MYSLNAKDSCLKQLKHDNYIAYAYKQQHKFLQKLAVEPGVMAMARPHEL